MKRLLIVGNSVSLTRPTAEGYPDALQKQLGDRWAIKTMVESALTVEDHEAPCIAALDADRPHVLILQVGVVDCAPRPLSRRERGWLSRVRPGRLQTRIVKFLHDHRARIIRLRGLNQWVKLPAFAASAGRIVAAARARGTHVLILPITRVTSYAELRQPSFNAEIAKYNAALERLQGEGVEFLHEEKLMAGLSPEQFSITEDSVHLNALGQARVTDALRERLLAIEAGLDRARASIQIKVGQEES